MIKVYFGPKGMGKTKLLIDNANKLSEKCKGVIVFVDNSNEHMYDLKHEIRFTNISEYPVACSKTMLGFICGMVSQDYDIEGIFIDGLTYIIGTDEKMDGFFKELEKISSKNSISFYISINGEKNMIPEYLNKFAV